MVETDHLSRALELHQAGRLDEAKAECRELLRHSPGHAVALNLLGFLEYQLGNGEKSIAAFRKAISAKPDFADAHFNLGNVFTSCDEPRQAATAYRALNPEDAEAHYLLANALLSIDELAAAEASLRAALERQPDHVDARTNLGYVLKRLGHYEEAAGQLRRALDLNPNSAECHNNLGTVLRNLRRFEEAAMAFREALRLKPDFIEAHNNLGHALFDMGELDAAIEAFGQALEIDPHDLSSCINLAGLGERSNRLDIAKAAIARGLGISSSDPSLHLLAAKCERREGQSEAAVKRLENIDGSAARDITAIDIAFELGQLYDRLDEPERAFQHFSEGNRLARQYPAHRDIDKGEFLALIDSISATLSRDWLSSWSEPPALSDHHAPAFIVGFPRSGTTLTEQILNAHPKLQTLDEKPTLDVMLARLADYPRSVAGLSGARIEELRTVYFDAVAEYAEFDGDSRIVDKMPLNIIHAAAIRRFFPAAKIILVLRHPCDACLSCFMQNFTVNSSMANFFSLADAARLYAHVKRLWQHSSELLGLDCHIVRYEDLVGDFEAETRKMRDFLELEWHPAVMEYAANARAQGKILTPRYHQVTEEIYQHAKYRWRRYGDRFEDFRALLEPFVSEFGYGWDQ